MKLEVRKTKKSGDRAEENKEKQGYSEGKPRKSGISAEENQEKRG